MAQIACDASFLPADTAEINRYVAEFGRFQAQLRTNATTYRVAIRPTILHKSASDMVFTSDDVRQIIQHANTYFSEINVQFYILNDEVNHVVDANLYNFKTTSEAELRALYDVNNAINIYFFHNITDEKGILLNGTAALPGYSNASNRIFFSYLDKNFEDFATLKNKIFLHELGHYFGLLHTFQDSNHGDITKRELVTRDLGTGANCNTTGDLLCDTQADPYERMPLISAYSCNEPLPDNLLDAKNYRFTPPIDNIMSYQVRCGNVFTSQQYQRMRAAFRIRFSPDADYRITDTGVNFIAINAFNQSVFCEGETVSIKYTTSGDFSGTNNLTVEISDENGLNFTQIKDVYYANKEVRWVIPVGLKGGSNYRFRITSAVPFVESPVSDPITIHTRGEIKLSLEQDIIRYGQKTNLIVEFGGSGPWFVNLDNGVTIRDITSRVYSLAVSPQVNTTYSVTVAGGKCGNLIPVNDVDLRVIFPTVVLPAGSNSKVTMCGSVNGELKADGLIENDDYTVHLYNDNNRYDIKAKAVGGALHFQTPPYHTGKSNVYKCIIDGSNIESYSELLSLSVSPAPEPPGNAPTAVYCFGAAALPMQAYGSRLTWYDSPESTAGVSQLIPNTQKSGTQTYYVTQTSLNGCESPKIAANVIIKPPVTASISGDNTIRFGEEATLQVKLTGESPWRVALSDGQEFSTTDSTIVTSVTPKETKVYTLTNVTNNCGMANIQGSAKVVVLSPLAEEESWETQLVAYPNPVAELLNVNLPEKMLLTDELSVKVFDASGRCLKYLEWKKSRNQTLNVSDLVPGMYHLQVRTATSTLQKRFVKN